MKPNHKILALDDIELDKTVKIASTQWDRKRKLTDKQIEKARRLFVKKHKSIEDIAKKFKVDPRTIRYHIDPTYRESRIAQARTLNRTPDKRTSKERFEERVTYKRQLIARGRLSV